MGHGFAGIWGDVLKAGKYIKKTKGLIKSPIKYIYPLVIVDMHHQNIYTYNIPIPVK
jgi:hypothetical protein